VINRRFQSSSQRGTDCNNPALLESFNIVQNFQSSSQRGTDCNGRFVSLQRDQSPLSVLFSTRNRLQLYRLPGEPLNPALPFSPLLNEEQTATKSRGT